MLSKTQIEQYHQNGYLVLRSQLEESDLSRFDEGLKRNPPLDGNVATIYPQAGRYTLAKNSLADVDLAFMAEHEKIVPIAETLLDDEVHLTAFVVYDRTPGGSPIGVHHDYKRWRPVGSSMNWLFTIIPLTDFTPETGQVFLAPGSHQLNRIKDVGEKVLHVDSAIRPADGDFIDPELKRGDLLVMNMHVWHKAAGNSSTIHRIGIFNKYAAAHYPPATGYYLFSNGVYEALSESGKKLLAVSSDRQIETTRILLERNYHAEPEYLVVPGDEGLTFPGGRSYVEKAIPDWDEGNFIASLQSNLRDKLRIETPWVTYVGDYEELNHLCRLYAYSLNRNGFPVAYREGEWLSQEEISARLDRFQFGYEADAITQWLDPKIIRGKGLSQAQSRIDQFAY